MQLTVLGCSGSFPSPHSPASSYLVSHHGTRVLLDLGNGAFGSLLAHISPHEVDAIVISHLHADHCADLVALYVWLKHGPSPSSRRLPVYGPSGLPARVAGIYSSGDADLSDVFEFRTFRGDEDIAVGSLTLRTALVAHPGQSYAIRVASEDRVLIYSGDTAECEALVALSRGANTALFEASFLEASTPPDAPVVGMHMSAAGAARVAQRAGVSHLVLTHVVHWQPQDSAALMDSLVAEARGHFGGEVSLARVHAATDC